MKKHVLLATGLAVLSTSAFATKARMEALGQDNNGGFYIQDDRNVFRNASALNNTKNYLVTEWGQDSKAEGGFFREMGSFAYGLYLGNDGDDRPTTPAGFENQQNSIDLMFAGDMGVKWGARVHYSDFDNKSTNKSAEGMGLGFGMEMGDIKAYANLTLKDESKGSTALAADKFDGDRMNVGASYMFSGMTFFADYDKSTKEVTNNAVKSETDYTNLTIGVGKIMEVSSTARVFTDVAYATTEEKVKSGTKTTTTSLPLTIGFEADATSWLTLRGSISQNVFINEKKVGSVKETQGNTTDVAAGATLNFGKLKVDGVIGNDTTNGENGALRTDELMSKVAVHYWF
ncbi:hypothetical protein M899_1325 [Bacteriovorax sp. BSW11_IV]|uniref:hypothetical protein n=1 Tax=Bacteriovorax sp. BSW11_IV TaxID=1353529 RepID=UPI000389DB5E|nr:hypothetical protein [Bacteriovorax sp. BSW11_IV]EQC45780.1 hypothetical protein M899_1325 [Bacteriovorax sp. BSW11_IV]